MVALLQKPGVAMSIFPQCTPETATLDPRLSAAGAVYRVHRRDLQNRPLGRAARFIGRAGHCHLGRRQFNEASATRASDTRSTGRFHACVDVEGNQRKKVRPTLESPSVESTFIPSQHLFLFAAGFPLAIPDEAVVGGVRVPARRQALLLVRGRTTGRLAPGS